MTVDARTLQIGMYFSIKDSSNVYKVESKFDDVFTAQLACKHTIEAHRYLRVPPGTPVTILANNEVSWHIAHAGWKNWEQEDRWEKIFMKVVGLLLIAASIRVVVSIPLPELLHFLVYAGPAAVIGMALLYGMFAAKTTRQLMTVFVLLTIYAGVLFVVVWRMTP